MALTSYKSPYLFFVKAVDPTPIYVQALSFISKEPNPKEEVQLSRERYRHTFMGGGGAMRTAAKIAGIGGVVQSGLRGSQSVPPVEQAVHKTSFPASAAIASSISVNAMRSEVALVEKSSTWDLDVVMSAGEPMPRIVFTGVPTIEEAKEATSELKDALDKVYLSKTECSETEEPSAADKVCGMSFSSETDSETKSCLVRETAITTSVPKHALQAFKVLSQNTNAQNVVASLASDLNVWNAVLQNSAVKEFFESQQKISSEMPLVEHQEGPESSEKCEDSSGEKQSRDFGDVLKNLLQDIKLTVNGMVSNVKSFLHDIFGDSGDPKSAYMDGTTLGASFMGLAIMAIMVILLKRA